MRAFDLLRLRKRRKLARKGFSQTGKIRRQEQPVKPENRHGPRSAFVAALVFTMVWLAASLSTLYLRTSSPAAEFVPGQVAQRYIYSEVPFEYADMNSTRRKREQAANREPPVYRLDTSAVESVMRRFDMVAQLAAPTAGDEIAPREDLHETDSWENRIQSLIEALPKQQRNALEYIFASREKSRLLRKLLLDTLNRGMVGDEDLVGFWGGKSVIDRIHIMTAPDESARKTVCPVNELQTPAVAASRVARYFAEGFPENAAVNTETLLAVLSPLLRPNLIYDFKATEEARSKAAAEVPVEKKTMAAGKILIRPGTRIAEEDLVRLQRHHEELQNHWRLRQNARDIFLSPAFSLALILAATYSLHIVRPDVMFHSASVVLLGFLLIVQILLPKGMEMLYYRHWNSSLFLIPLLPLSLVSMVASPLLGVRVAVWAGVLTSTITALHMGQSLHVLLTGCFSCIAAAWLMRKACKRVHYFRTGLGVSVVVFVMHCLFLFRSEVPLEVIPRTLLLAFVNGFVVAVATSVSLPVLEWLFGMTTEATLLELSDLNHPLLKRLQLEAPGTYHHSLMVATLAEQAAAAIGANPLLCRVSAYFHDIGKLSYPVYFTENTGEENPHDELQPRMSSLVILNHVKDGIDLALQHKLKKPIREAIAQHHGTSLVYFFYRRALELRGSNGESGGVGEQDYRYVGPLPQRREIVIISLADACEAAARSLEKPTVRKIATLVDEIIMARVRDHQLDEADLTFAELAVVKQTMAKTLGMMMHSRIRYPKEYAHERDSGKTPAASGPQGSGSAAENHPSGNATDRNGGATGKLRSESKSERDTGGRRGDSRTEPPVSGTV